MWPMETVGPTTAALQHAVLSDMSPEPASGPPNTWLGAFSFDADESATQHTYRLCACGAPKSRDLPSQDVRPSGRRLSLRPFPATRGKACSRWHLTRIRRVPNAVDRVSLQTCVGFQPATKYTPWTMIYRAPVLLCSRA